MSDLHQLRALCQSVANGEPHAEVRLVECVLSLPFDEYPMSEAGLSDLEITEAAC